MGERTEYKPGQFCWVDLGTTDAAAATQFYSRLFGWEPEEQPGAAGTYTLLKIGGKKVAGLYEVSEEQRAQGAPAAWLSYISVASANDVAATAKGLGATIISEPFDVMDAGRMAVLADPTGAVFALWERGSQFGAELVNDPNAWIWNELATKEDAVAHDFYRDLFGWDIQVSETPVGRYSMCSKGDLQIAGIHQQGPEESGVPAHWLPYFRVADVDAIASSAKDLGGEIRVPPTDVPAGRFAAMADPQGAGFGAMQLTEEPPV